MIIDRDKHNKYVVGWKPNYTVPTNQGSSSGTNVTIVYGGGGSGSSTPVSSEAFSYYKVSDGENVITQEAKVLKDIANLSIIGDEGIKVELITDPTIFEASFTSTGINEGVYKISYGKVTTVVELPTESETLAEEPTEPEVVITFPMTITYVSGEKIKAELFDTLRLLNDTEEVATYPSSGLAIEGDADGILSISLEVYKEVLSVDEEGKPVQDAEGNPVMEKLGLYFNRILLTSLLEDQPSTQAEGDSTEEEPQLPTYESLLSFDVVVNIDTVIKLSSDSGAGLWKLDDNGNIYTEYNAYSLKELSAYGPGEGEAGEGVGFLHELGDVSIPAPNEIPDNAILQYNIETDKWEAVEWSELDDTATREWVELKFKNLINGAPADLDTLGEIAIVIQELQQLLDWFSFVDGRIRANYDFWGVGEISAYGPASGSDPGTGGGAGYLHELGDVTINNDTLTDGLIIVWDEDSLMWVNVDFAGLDEDALALYLTQNKYATLGWVNSQLDPINNKLGEFQTTIDMINDMFEWDNGKIKAKATLYSIGEISAYGAGGGSSSIVGYLHELEDVLLTDLLDDLLLMYDATIGKWINVDKNSVGLNETELKQYLTTHNYVTSNQVVPPTRRITAGTGLTGGGALSSDVTLSLATSGVTSGVYTKVTVDLYGRVTLGALLVENDIPDIAWSKIHSTPTTLAGYGITDAYTMLQSDERYVNVTGDIMTGNLILPTLQANTSIILGSVKLEYDSASNALKISNVNTQLVINLYATGEISAYGYNNGSADEGVSTLNDLDDVTLSNLLNGQALVYNSSTGQWVNTTILAGGIDEAALAAYLTDNRYATQQWVTSQNYLTAVSVDTISDLHSSWDAVLKAQKPAWLTTVSLATISDLHASWDSLLKAAPSAYVTRWPTFSEITGKPTTLSGYGITDGVNAVNVTGSGNAVTTANVSGHTLTLTKGSTFLLSSAYTAADVLAKLKTVDGSGSGLDADTLDGLQASSFQRAVSEHLETELSGGGRGKFVILLHPDTLSDTENNLPDGYSVQGTFYLYRSVGNCTASIIVNSGAGYSVRWSNGSMIVVSGILYFNIKFVTCTYGGKLYKAIYLEANQDILQLDFRGVVHNKDANFGKAVQFYSYASSAVTNTEVNGSLKDFTKSNRVFIPHGIESPSVKIGNGTITWDATNNCFHFSHGLYSDSFVSAKGANSGSGGTVSGVTKLSDLSDVQLGTLATNQILSWNGSKWVNKAISTGLDETALAQYLTNNQYLTMPTGDGRYALKGGSNATGTWPISISGQSMTLGNNPTGLSNATYGTYGGFLQGSSIGPTSNTWYNIIKILHGNSDGYYTELAQSFTGTEGLWHRRMFIGSVSAWKAILDSSNYTAYTVTKTGGGASGTWPISINGNATTASRWSTARTLTLTGNATGSVSMNGSSNVSMSVNVNYATSAGNSDTLDGYHGSSSNTTNTYVLRNSNAGALVNEITFPLVNFPKDDPPRANISPMSLRVWDSYNQSVVGGDAYGTVLEFCARQSHWNHQLYFQAIGHNIWHRASAYNDSSWTYGWVKLATVNDNVASASKLQTSQKIWGQPFNGTAPVSGNMTGVGSITGSGNISMSGSITAGAYVYSSGWFQNQQSGEGLYNSAVDARWYANGSGWISDKKINANAGLKVSGTTTLGAAVQVPYSGSSWISMATRTNLIYSTTNNSTDSAHALYRVKANNGNALCFGGLGNKLGFYAFTAANISSGTNAVWKNTYWDMTNWTLHHGGVLHCSGGIYSDSYVSAKGNNSSSDIRLKNILCPVHPSLKDFAKAPLFRFAWKSNPGMMEIGSSAQYWKNVLPDTVKERDGWLEMGYGNIALAGVITIARDFETLEQRVDRLEKENGKLKKKIKELERRTT